MAKIYGQIEKAQFENLAGDPASTALGYVYYNTGTNTVKYYNGSAWKTVVNLDGSQVLTAKDYDGGTASNTSRITVPKDTFANITALNRKEGTLWYASDIDKLYVDDGSTLIAVGSGSGAGGINYIDQFDIEGAVTGYVTYADAAQSTPVDATGGAPTVTVAKSAVSPLRGLNSLLFTKDAANRQGEGFAYAISIAATDQAKLFTWEMDYTISSGTFATGDVSLFVYDVTNAAVIWCTPYQIENLTGYGKIKVNFQTASNSQSYRLVWHVASTSASAYTMRFDNILCGPQQITYGAVVSEWMSFTPTGSWVTNSTYYGKYRRVGDTLEVSVKIETSGAPTATALTVNLPSGLTIDTTKIPNGGDNNNYSIGLASILDSGVAYYTGFVGYNTTTSVAVMAERTAAAPGFDDHGASVNSTTPMTFGANDAVRLDFKVPVLGWGVSQSISGVDAGDGRVVAASVKRTATQSINNSTDTKVQLNVLSKDSHNSFDLVTNYRYTIPVTGWYEASAIMSFAANAAGERRITLYKNGSSHKILDNDPSNAAGDGTILSGSHLDYYISGDYLELYARQSSGGALNICTESGSAESFTVERLQGASSLVSGETVACRYTTAAGQSINNSTITIVDFGTKSFDTGAGGTVTTGAAWKWTSNRTQKVSVKAFVAFASSSVLNSQFNAYIYKNGAAYERAFKYKPTASGLAWEISVFDEVEVVPGDYLDIRVSQDTGGALALLSDATLNYVSITGDGA